LIFDEVTDKNKLALFLWPTVYTDTRVNRLSKENIMLFRCWRFESALYWNS